MNIISHRGNGFGLKENTKESLLYAINNKDIDGIEFDIRMTKDRKIVIIHDLIINFVSNGSGIVSKMKYKKLLKYNFGTIYNPSKICLLEELLDNIYNNKIILIELKTNKFNQIFIDNVLSIIKKYDLNIFLISFNYETIKYINKYYNKCGLLIGNGINEDKLYNKFNYNFVTYKFKNINKKETFIWTLNEIKEDIHNFNIITDKYYMFR